MPPSANEDDAIWVLFVAEGMAKPCGVGDGRSSNGDREARPWLGAHGGGERISGSTGFAAVMIEGGWVIEFDAVKGAEKRVNCD
ncbi:hypothetical protein M0R45_006691 [Rubus argutus]|uniref:Uncharacterized protein n=1 Tax=Rubus argutus TaxID=59490 RepID=A0AAW1YRH1_RUBAR